MSKKVVSLSIDTELLEKLKQLSKKDYTTLSSYIVKLIVESLDARNNASKQD